MPLHMNGVVPRRPPVKERDTLFPVITIDGGFGFIPAYGTLSGRGFTNPETGGSLSTADHADALQVLLLNLNASFLETDRLTLTFSSGNNGIDTASDLGLTFYPNSTVNAGQPTFAALGTNALSLFLNQPTLFRLSYTFEPLDDVTVTIGPRFFAVDILDFNSYGNNPFVDFSSYIFTNNPFILPFGLNFYGGAGAAVQYQLPEDGLSFRALYLADGMTEGRFTVADGDLYSDPFQATFELEYAQPIATDGIDSNYAVKLQYTHSDTFGVIQDAYGINAEYTLGSLGLFARVGLSKARVSEALTPELTGQQLDFTGYTWSAGMVTTDSLMHDSALGIAMGQPFLHDLAGTNAFGPNTKNQTNYEAFFRMGSTFSVTPGVTYIDAPNNDAEQAGIIEGFLRFVFLF